MKRKDVPPALEAKPVAEDMIVAAARHHLLDEHAARPRLRPGKGGGETKE